MNKKFADYYRIDRLPYIWCAGCGNGIVLNGLVEAFDKLKIDKNRTVIVSGIGCSSRAPLYLNFDTLHTTHGRAIAFATGIKFANPELNVIVLTGDGDAAAIGGNHLIHAARRNIDLTVICFNNSNYGMTNGQFSPTTPQMAYTSTTPYGMIERGFDLCKLVEGAGATYVARTTTYHIRMLPNMIVNAIKNQGFSFIDVIAQCPTYFGRKNKLTTAVEMLKYMRDNSITRKEAATKSTEELEGKIIIGEFVNKQAPEFTSEYNKLIERLKTNKSEERINV